MEVESKNHFVAIIRVFWLCGIHEVDENWHFVKKLLYLTWRCFNIFASFLGIIQSFLYVITVEKFDLVDCSSPILNTGLYIGMVVRILYFATHVDKAMKLIKIINEEFIYKVYTPFGEKTMDYYYDMTYKLVLFWQIYLPVVGFFMIVSPIINIYRIGERELPAKFYSPYEWWQSPYWEFTLIQQVFMQTMLGVIYTNSDTFFFSIVFLTCGQFSLLNEKLKNIVYTSLINCNINKEKVTCFSQSFNANIDDNEEFITNEEKEDIIAEMQTVIKNKEFDVNFHRELIDCVEMHQFLKEFLGKSQDFLSPCLFPIVFLTTSYLIFVSYNFINNSEGMVFSLLTQIIALLFQLIIFTYFGQQLTNEYEKLFVNLYTSPWYLCNNNNKKMLLIMQINLLKPLAFSVGKLLTFNLPTLVNILRSYMSYLAVLRTIEN